MNFLRIGSSLRLISILLLFVLQQASSAFAANESPRAFTYQGKLLNGGIAVTDANATIKFRIWDSAAHTCLLYSESQVVTLTNGVFAARIGSNTGDPKRVGGEDQTLTMANIFANTGTALLAPLTLNCAPGYIPAAGDTRTLEVIITAAGGGGGNPLPAPPITLAPDQTLNSMNQTWVAETLQGKDASQFVNIDVANNLTQANALVLVGGTGAGGDAALLHQHDSRYIMSNSPANQNLGTGNIYTTGNIGVGTGAAPATDIEIRRGAGVNATLRIGSTGAVGATTALEFYGNGLPRASIESIDNANIMNFKTGGAQALQLDNNQNAIFSGAVVVTRTVGLGNYTNPGTEPGLIASLLPANSGTMWYNSTNGVLRFWNGAAAVTVASWPASDASFDVTDAGTSTKHLKFDVSNLAAGTRTVTWPDANMFMPAFAGYTANRTLTMPDVNLTIAGPTAARTITFPDANITVARTDAAQTFTGTQTFSSAINSSVGTAALPGYTFTGDVNTGLSAAVGDTLLISTAGVERMQFGPTGLNSIGAVAPSARLTLPAGTGIASEAPLKFTTGTNLPAVENGAMEYDGTDYYLSSGGTRRRITVSSGGAGDFLDLAGVNVMTGTLKHAIGTAALPGMTFAGDTNTGISAQTADTLLISTSGTERMQFDPNGLTSIGAVAPSARLTLPAGAAGASQAPLKFTSGTNLAAVENGTVEYNGTNLYFSAGGVRQAIPTFPTSVLTITGPTAARTITLPDANITVARTDAAQTFTGIQTFNTTITSVDGTFSSSVADGAAAKAFNMNSSNAYATGGARLLVLQNNGTDKLAVDKDGKLGVAGVTAPGAYIELPAGTAAVGTGPLKFTSGTNLAAVVNGMMEYDGTNLYFSTGGIRQTINLGAGSAFPVTDTTFDVTDTATSTRHLKFNVGSIAVGTKTVTWPDATMNMPVFPTSTLTFTGPTAARTITLPDANITIARTDAAQTFTGNQTMIGAVMMNAQNEVRFGDADSSNYVAFKSGDPVGANVTWTLPLADGAAGQVLSTSGAGVLSWVANGAGGLPVDDGTAVVKGSVTAGKLLRFEVDGYAAAGTHVITVPDADIFLPNFAGYTANRTLTMPDVNLTIAGPTAARTITFPDANITVARTDAAQTFTGIQTFNTTITSVDGTLSSSVADGAAAKAFNMNSSNAYATAGARLLVLQNNGTDKLAVDKDGKLGVGGVTAPAAYIEMPGSTGAAGTGPLKFTSGTNLAAVVNGIMEYDGTDYYLSSGGTRRIIAVSTAGFLDLAGVNVMTGTLKHAIGTAALPGMTFAGDVNTGISAQTADTLVLSTSGVGRMTLDSAGGIYAGKGITDAAPASVTINATGGNAGGVNGADIKIAGGVGGAAADAGGDIILQTARSGAGTTLIDRLTVSKDGSLQMTGILNANAPAVSAANTGRIYYNSTDQKFKVSLNGVAYEDIMTSGATGGFLRLDGTNSMTGAINTTVGTMVSSLADGAAAKAFNMNTAAYTTAGARLLTVQNNGTDYFAIDKDGKVGIGSISAPAPAYPFDLQQITTINNANVVNGLSSLTVRPSANSVGAIIYQGFTGIGTTDGSTSFDVASAGSGIIGLRGSGVGNHVAARTVGSVVGVYGSGANIGAGTTTNNIGVYGLGSASAGTVSSVFGVEGVGSNTTAGLTIPNAYGIYGAVITNNATATITNAYGVHGSVTNTLGTITTGYSMFVGPSAGTTKWGLYQNTAVDNNYFAGKVGHGITPTALVHMAAGSGNANETPLKFTSGTNVAVVENGAMEYNGTDFFLSSGGVRNKIVVGTSSTGFPVTDAVFDVSDDGDTTKHVKFQVSGVSAGTTRTLTVPNADTTLAILTGAGTANNLLLGVSVGNPAGLTGSNNMVMGATITGNALTSADDNVIIGVGAGNTMNTADRNTFVGRTAGNAATSGSDNTFIGNQAGQANVTGVENTAIGSVAGLNATGSSNTFLGFGAGRAAANSGANNTFIGHNAGFANTTGDNATYIGKDAGLSNTIGDYNIYIGYSTDGSTTTTSSIGIGYNTTVTANNQLVVGSDDANGQLTESYWGNGVRAPASTAGGSFVFNGTGGGDTTNNQAGGNLTFAGGKGTGTALGGSIIFQTSAKQAAADTLNALQERMRIDATSTGANGEATSRVSVTGQLYSKSYTGYAANTQTINWDYSNVVVITYTDGAAKTLVFNNMQEGGAYTLVAINTGATLTGNFNLPAGTKVKAPCVLADTLTTGTTNVYTFVYAGGIVYSSCINGF